jgi:hypothetical protein
LAFFALAAVHQAMRGNRKKLMVALFVVLPIIFVIIGFQRSTSSEAISLSYFAEAFETGHFSLVDVVALTLSDNFSADLGLTYYIAALAGPFRDLFGFSEIRSASEIFTIAYDPDRFFNTRSLIAVGAFSEELIIMGSTTGMLIVVVVVAALSGARNALIRKIGTVYPAATTIDIVFGMYFLLYLRTDIWITSVYLWLHLPFWALVVIWARREMRRRQRFEISAAKVALP